MANEKVIIEFKADDKGLISHLNKLDKISKSLVQTQNKLQKSIKQGTDSNNKLQKSIKQEINLQNKRNKAIKKIRIALTDVGSSFKKAGISTKTYTDAVKGNKRALSRLKLQADKHINSLKKLESQTRRTTQTTRRSTSTQTKLSKSQDKTSQRTRILGGTFAVVRSKMLLFNFAMGLGITQLIRLGREAAKLESIERGFNTLTKATSANMNGLHKLQKATDGTVNKLELMKQANNALILGVTDNTDEMAKMFDIAQRLGRALGRDTATSIESLVTGIGRQSRLMLDNIGIIVKSEEAYEKYALKIDKSVESLTDADKKQAFFEATMESARAKVAALGLEVLSTEDAYDQLAVATKHLGLEIGRFFSPVAVFLAKVLQVGAESSKEFMRSLTETKLDRTIRELKELGASSEALMQLEKIQLDRNLAKYNFELTKAKKSFTDIDKLQEAIKKADTDRAKFANIVAKSEENRLKLQNELHALEKVGDDKRDKRLSLNQALRASYHEEEQAVIRSQIAKIDETWTAEVEANNKLIAQKKEEIALHQGITDQAFLALEALGIEGDELQKNLEILTGIKFTKEQIDALSKSTSKSSKETAEANSTTLQREIALLQMKKEFQEGGLSIDEQIKLNTQERKNIEEEINNPDRTETLQELKKKGLELDIQGIKLKEQLKEATLSGTSDMLTSFAGLNTALKSNTLVSARLSQAGAIIDTYAGANKAFEQGGTLGFVTGAAIIAQGLANVATIQSQISGMQSFEHGGMVGGNRHSQGGTIIEAERGEFVMSRNAVESIGIDNLANMNQGGASGVTVNIQGNMIGNESFVRDVLIPEIDKTVNKGLA
tara:strand:+ start:1106 stop:3616 length:2511 start_codon:yes stop_codon:yes gene_type:complete